MACRRRPGQSNRAGSHSRFAIHQPQDHANPTGHDDTACKRRLEASSPADIHSTSDVVADNNTARVRV
jgi:hypothetical protein